ncbi:MAG: hypothetical protein ACKORB_00045 [Opitutia bacterium]
MPRKRLRSLAALLVTAAVVHGQPVPPQGAPHIEGDEPTYSENGKVLTVRNAVVRSGTTSLWAKMVRADLANGIIHAEGDVIYSGGDLRIFSETIDIDRRKDLIVARKVRFGRAPVHFTAEELTIRGEDRSMRGLRAWFNEPHPDGMHLRVQELDYVAKTDRASLGSATGYVAGVPFAHLPGYSQKGLREFPYDIFLRTGSNNVQGRFLRSTVLARQSDSLWAGPVLDYYDESGVLYGPALRYDTDKSRTGRGWLAEIEGGFLDDRSTLPTDYYGRPIGSDRHFFYGDIVGRTEGGVDVAGQLYATSDPLMLRDMRPNLVNRSGRPRANLEATAQFDSGYASAGLVAKVDDYQDVVQKLPELRLDMPTAAFGANGLQSRSFLTFAYLTERPSTELPLPAYQQQTLHNGSWSSARIDGYYGLAYPVHSGDWLTFRPVVGARLTSWTEGLNGTGAASKAIGQVGFDLETLLTGQWDTRSEGWKVDGLRHTMRPFVQYRAMPGADRELGTAPPAERAVAVNILEELDLADRLDSATTRDTQSMRMGVRNTLATRADNGGTRDLLRADFFTDWRDGPTADEDGRGDLHARLRWTPADWLAFDSIQRLPNGGGSPLESIQSVRVKSGDLWSAEVNWIEFGRFDPTRQLAANATVRLNSVFSLSGTTLYDARAGRNIGQWLRLQQTVGNTWMIEYGLERISDPRDPRNLGFYIEFRLFRF